MEHKIQSAFDGIHADNALVDSTMAYLRSQREKKQSRSRGLSIPKLAGAFATAAVLFMGIAAFNLYTTAAAYVSIDVNPSLELTLNRFDRVIDARAFNEEGERILSETPVKGKDYDKAVDLLFSCMEANGYLADDFSISVTVQTQSSQTEARLCPALQECVDRQMFASQSAGTAEVFTVSAEVHGNARQCNMTPARYQAIQELLEVDAEASVDAYRDCSLGQIRQRTQDCRAANSQGQGQGQGQGMQQGHGAGQGQGAGQGNNRNYD
ncbi:MAG: hypothetical protein FWF91_06155 [Coriobacteriia bacterium]|nr:hypothetical protein [Coriobacteriia bacterium]